jgi:cell division protein FtsB
MSPVALPPACVRRAGMKLLTLALVALIALLQHPLWLGKGSWLRVWEIDQQVSMQRDTNQKLAMRNASLDAEVRDLKEGLDAVEERARSELGMIKRDEMFFQVLDGQRGATPAAR